MKKTGYKASREGGDELSLIIYMEDHAELFVWLDGREWFMDSVN